MFGPTWYFMTQPPKMSVMADFFNFVKIDFFLISRPFSDKEYLVQKNRTPIMA